MRVVAEAQPGYRFYIDFYAVRRGPHDTVRVAADKNVHHRAPKDEGFAVTVRGDGLLVLTYHPGYIHPTPFQIGDAKTGDRPASFKKLNDAIRDYIQPLTPEGVRPGEAAWLYEHNPVQRGTLFRRRRPGTTLVRRRNDLRWEYKDGLRGWEPLQA